MSRDTGSRAFRNARLRKQQKKVVGSAEALILEQCGFDADPQAPGGVDARNPVSELFAQAATLHQRGSVSEAQALCREILQRNPNHFDALHLLSTCEYQSGRHEEADRLLKQALAVSPRSAAAYCNRGLVLAELKRFDEALASFDKAIAIMPDCVEAFSNSGNVLSELGRLEDAIARYDAALKIKPAYVDALINRANVLAELRRLDEALASCDKALALRPDNAAALSSRGNTLLELKRFAEALASFDQAIAIKPDFAAAWFGRASALLHDKRYAEAFAAYNQVLTIEPDHYKALAQLAWWYERQGDIKGVLSCYDQALAIKPDFATAIENKIFVLDFAPNVGFVEHQEARKNWWQQIGAKIAAKSQLPHNNSRDPQRRIVLGYVSSDFRKHSAALVTWPVLKHHDQTRFEIVCYSCSTIEDEFTEKFRQMATKWRNASQLSDARLADQIRADNVDILIDLSGHTAGNRLGTFARRPAPIQVTAWGNATGTGLATIDYLFSDPVTVPNDVRRLFAEKIYDLPCALTIEELPTGPSDPPVLANKYVTFGFFNRTSKISDDAVAVWASILGAEHGSRLLIKHFEVEDESVRNLLRGRFAKHGISADRIDFLGSSNRWEHLVAHNNVDICFDPFPQNGGVSTWESLHMGVPVVAMLGNSVSTRIAGAILSSIGMSEWVARSPDEYAAIALKYSSDPDYLKKLRHELPARISASPAGNAAHYTKAVEAAYIAMWEDYCTRRA